MTSLRRTTARLRPILREAVLNVARPLTDRQDQLRVAVGRVESRQVRTMRPESIHEAEFRVYSQFGEDGIIQYLIERAKVTSDVFVEFGVEDYRESNTRLLLEKDGWSGLIIDAGTAHQRFVNHPRYRWRYPVEAISAFITRENINDLIASGGTSGEIGLLSVDLDGNDYWVWEAIDVVRPQIVVVEYNSIFGPHATVSVPYDPMFDRTTAHWSTLYFGASLGALCHLAEQREFVCVGCTTAGNNAFFVRKDAANGLAALSAKSAFVQSRFREARTPMGDFVDTHMEGLRSIADLPVVDVITSDLLTVAAVVDRDD